MAYKFENDESVREGFARCAGEQLDHAVGELSEQINVDPVEAVHSARKSVKKARSLLRLARGSMPAAQRRRENRALRDAARQLSAARDAEAMVATVEQLADRYVGQLPESDFSAVREQLEQSRDAQRRVLLGSTLGARAVEELGAVRVRVADWKLVSGGWASIEDGLRRSYVDGRGAFRRARSHRTIGDWHAWRKRVKDLWYQERLLAPAGGPIVSGHAKDAHRLADLLGDDHDLGVLREALARGAIQAPADVDALLGLIDHRRGELQTEALHVGERVYAEKPAAFVRRQRRAWKAGRRRAKEAPAHHPTALAEASRPATVT
jgi:CHAD domain-containing protein